jgi:isoleucyl-tRNA synthetase
MKSAAARIETLSQPEIQGLLEGAVLSIELGGSAAGAPPRTVEITREKIDIRRIEKANLRVLNEGTLTVALDTEITAELSREGDVRDLIRGVQNLRKDSGFAVTDRIRVSLSGSERLKQAWEALADYVAAEILAVSTVWETVPGQIPLEAGDDRWQVKIEKA